MTEENGTDRIPVEAIVIRDFCGMCDKTQECRTVSHCSGIETLCNVCGHQVDFDINEECDDDYSEPVGSCENCGTNLYEDDDEDLCDQCLWRSQFGG
jgi:hypothetical protein